MEREGCHRWLAAIPSLSQLGWKWCNGDASLNKPWEQNEAASHLMLRVIRRCEREKTPKILP